MRKLLRFWVLGIILFFALTAHFSALIKSVYAQTASQFYTDYKVTYDIDLSGETNVTEQVSLTNLTDNYYASSFALTIGATQISDVKALDSGGFDMVSNMQKMGSKTKITVNFNSQIAGKGKVQSFTLSFKSKDFVENQGKIWQVSVPKIASVEDVNTYSLILEVPLEFGDPTQILPLPSSQSQVGDKIYLNYNKETLSKSGILATFGENQLMGFNLTFHLKNSGILPSLISVPIPSDTDFQQIQIDNISPSPQNVTVDEDGNDLAWFKVGRYSSLDVKVEGEAKLFLKNRESLPGLSKTYSTDLTSPQKYWDSDNPLIAQRLSEIFKGSYSASNSEKANLIDNFLVNDLTFDSDRLDGKDFTRLGGLTTLNNPDQALDNDFVDAFISLCRAAGIPARELDGFAYTSNPILRPSSLGGTTLHAWAEYFDSQKGWVMVDPTWTNTTGGVDYFSRFDLNHLVLATKGVSSTGPNTTGDVRVNFSSATFNPHPDLLVKTNYPGQLYAGFPGKLGVEILNQGSATSLVSTLSLNPGKISVSGQTTFNIPQIPPFGRLDYSFDLRESNLSSSFSDNLSLIVSNKLYNMVILVKPFFAFNFFPYIIFAILGVMVLTYSGILTYHIRAYRRHKRAKK